MLTKNLYFLLALFGAHMLHAQQENTTVVRFIHPVLEKVDNLVTSLRYQEAITQSLKQAQQLKNEGNWEGYITFMLRAAEIETFEVWKARGFPEIKIQPDYRRPLSYLDDLDKYGGKYIDRYPYLKANILFTKAVVYDWLNMSDTAERMHLQAMQLRVKLFGEESREVADSYLWLGVLYRWGLNRKDLAKHYYLKALPLQKKFMPVSRYALGSTYYGLAVIARENFEFDEAEMLATQYSSLYQDLPYEQSAGFQLIANIYWNQGDFEKSFQQRMRSINVLEASGFKENLIVEYSNLSSDLKGLGRYQEAKSALKKGVKILERSTIKDPFHAKVLYENLGDLYRVMKKYDSSRFYFDKALQIGLDTYGKNNEEVADVYDLRGKLFIARDNYKSGLDDFQQMLASVIPDFHPNDLTAIPEIQKENPYFMTIIAALFNKGDALVEWYNRDMDPGHLELALNNYRAAYEQLMIARKTIGDELSKPFLMINFAKSIEKSIYCAKVLYQNKKLPRYFQDIFHFVELTKYLNVLDALQRAERANNSGVPKSLLFQLDDVRKELNSIQKTIMTASEVSEDSVSRLNEAAVDLINRRRELMAEVSRYPDHTSLSLDSMLLSVNEIQRNLSQAEQILEFFWGVDSIYIISITDKTVGISSLQHRPESDSLLSFIYRFMNTTPSFDQDRIKQYSVSTSEIYKQFFAPFITKKKLKIIPDGPLSVVSVEALVVNTNPVNITYNTLDYLIHHCEISYAYSSSILFKNALKNVKSIENVLAFSYSGGPGIPSIAHRDRQAELPGTFKELEALSRLFKNVMRFTDMDASKSNFINNASGFDIIHLGIHGIGDQEVADNSRLIFRNDSLNDAELYAYEIYNLKLDAGLVVLSACESGVGRSQDGEGMFSIARAFTYAGCPSLVMSLWQVPDIFTSQIMIGFYENLERNAPISGSLRNAKLQFLKESDPFSAHPANWAAFVVNGQDMTFEKRSSNHYWIYISIAFLVIVVVAVFLKKRRD